MNGLTRVALFVFLVNIWGNGVLVESWTGNIVFQDEFEGNSLDLSKWEYESGSTGTKVQNKS